MPDEAFARVLGSPHPSPCSGENSWAAGRRHQLQSHPAVSFVCEHAVARQRRLASSDAVGQGPLADHRTALANEGRCAWLALPRERSAALARHLLPLFAGLRQADGDRLLSTRHLATLAALAAPETAALPPSHRALDVFARSPAVFSRSGLSRHDASSRQSSFR